VSFSFLLSGVFRSLTFWIHYTTLGGGCQGVFSNFFEKLFGGEGGTRHPLRLRILCEVLIGLISVGHFPLEHLQYSTLGVGCQGVFRFSLKNFFVALGMVLFFTASAVSVGIPARAP
jgi:hypothetical protein